MRKLIVITHTSFDGFVAGPNREFDNFIGDEENLAFVCSLTDEADAALFGRVSYELINAHWPTAATRPDATAATIKYSKWYNRVPKYVLSQRLKADSSSNTNIISENIAKEINGIKQSREGSKNILMFGGPTAIHSLLDADVVDGFWLLLHPVIFGKGLPLFNNNIDKVIRLTLTTSNQLTNGMLCLFYSVNR